MAAILAPDVSQKRLRAVVSMHSSGGNISITFGDQRTECGKLLTVFEELQRGIDDLRLTGIVATREFFFDELTTTVRDCYSKLSIIHG